MPSTNPSESTQIKIGRPYPNGGASFAIRQAGGRPPPRHQGPLWSRKYLLRRGSIYDHRLCTPTTASLPHKLQRPWRVWRRGLLVLLGILRPLVRNRDEHVPFILLRAWMVRAGQVPVRRFMVWRELRSIYKQHMSDGLLGPWTLCARPLPLR